MNCLLHPESSRAESAGRALPLIAFPALGCGSRGCYRVGDTLTETLLVGSVEGCAVETSGRQRRGLHIEEEEGESSVSG